MSTAAQAVSSALKIVPRRSGTRGHADHGWLKTYHTFSFASWYDPAFEAFGSLRVINEDRVDPSEGFGKHSHREFEIFSYIVSGELEHRDSMGNLEIMKEGDIQMTSTGTGIAHSEYNRNSKTPVHFLQIWALPHTRGLAPQYYNRHFPRQAKLDTLVKVVAPVGTVDVSDERLGSGPAPVHSHLSMWASILTDKGKSVRHSLATDTKRAYLQLIMKSGYRRPNVAAGDKFEDGGARVRVNRGLVLEEGDGAFVTLEGEGSKEIEVENVGEREAEFLLFEMQD
ncbi:pirin family protein [Sporobolomyces koalae]|uniref:pirin family protein n=1 Tax=Sporobolomyces koalae TaxID=500713 RepID=UPI00316DBBC4